MIPNIHEFHHEWEQDLYDRWAEQGLYAPQPWSAEQLHPHDEQTIEEGETFYLIYQPERFHIITERDIVPF